MRSWTQFKSDTAKECGIASTDTAKLTVLGGYINDSVRAMASTRKGKWPFLYDRYETPTVAGQENYPIPQRFRKLSSVIVEIDNENNANSVTRYQPTPIFDQNAWNRVLVSNLGESDWPMFVFVKNRELALAPVPSSDGATIVMTGRLNLKDLSFENYTTGTITTVPYALAFTGALADGATSGTLTGAFSFATGEYQVEFSNGEVRLATFTNASTAVTWDNELTSAATANITVSGSKGGTILTGSSTSWTTGMEGRYIRITSTAAANGGDNYWYKIDQVLDDTHLSLTEPYQGEDISAGSAAYVMGEMSVIPESYDIGVVYRSSALWWASQGEAERAKGYWMRYDGGVEIGESKSYGGIVAQMMDDVGETVEGAYISPNLITTRLDPNNPQQSVGSASFAP